MLKKLSPTTALTSCKDAFASQFWMLYRVGQKLLCDQWVENKYHKTRKEETIRVESPVVKEAILEVVSSHASLNVENTRHLRMEPDVSRWSTRAT